jgi:hypothetical protein
LADLTPVFWFSFGGSEGHFGVRSQKLSFLNFHAELKFLNDALGDLTPVFWFSFGGRVAGQNVVFLMSLHGHVRLL